MDHFTCKLTIGNRHYGMRKMSPIDAAPFATRVIKCMSGIIDSPNIVKTLETFYSKIKDKIDTDNTKHESKIENINTENLNIEQEDMMKMGLSIMSLFSNIDPDELNIIFKQAFASEVFNGENEKLSDETIFHKHFQQYAQDYYPVALWIVINNVKPFLGSVGDGMKALFQSFKSHQDPTQK